jgi:demethylmenaquinone methyltransferase/2-methoxy-6-polyprenyl-1,4-benzoquinol methylase
MSQPDNAFLRFLSRLHIRLIMPVIARIAGGNRSAYEYLASSTLKFPGKQALAQEWEAAGIKNVTSHSLMMGTIAIHTGTKESTE